jgi:hypothetical protein
MPKLIAQYCLLLILLPILSAPGFDRIVFGVAAAADIQEHPAAKLRLSQRSDQECIDKCIAECRADKSECSGGKGSNDACRARFQICARRCVVSCGSH